MNPTESISFDAFSAAVPDRVARGIQWLDTNRPGWREKIVPQNLDMGNCNRCILGQIFGDYYDVAGDKFCRNITEQIPYQTAITYGFIVEYPASQLHREETTNPYWERLADEWRKHLPVPKEQPC